MVLSAAAKRLCLSSDSSVPRISSVASTLLIEPDRTGIAEEKQS
jgi:hypothetical protein